MYRSRVNYWSCSKFANWLLKHFCGAGKPNALSLEDWDTWHQNAENNNKLVHWFVDTVLNKLQNIYCFPSDMHREIRRYVDNRFVAKTHVINTKLKPGQWHEFDTRVLNGLFEQFVDFVEVEQAVNHIAWSDDDVRNKYKLPWWKTLWYPFPAGRWRNAEVGLIHLNWAAALVYEKEECGEDDPRIGTPTHQAIAAQEQLALYDWWKNVRPNRPDPYDVSGWNQLQEDLRIKYPDAKGLRGLFSSRSEEEQELSSKTMKGGHDIEQLYNDEDTEMLIRLIKIRSNLWT